MRRWIGVLCLLCVSVAAGCKKKSEGEEAARSATKQPPKRPVVKKVKLPIPDPFGLGAAPTTARPGDFVVCPPREWIDKVLETGKPELQTFILYGARMVEPGPAESRVKSLTGKEMMIPNYLVVPIHRGQSAVPGDILLTVWQSGSGMQRAIVVEGGTPTEPMVRYLDIALDNPSGAGERADRCKPDTFHKLTDAWQVGTSEGPSWRCSGVLRTLLCIGSRAMLRSSMIPQPPSVMMMR